jgi:hypothetical protein
MKIGVKGFAGAIDAFFLVIYFWNRALSASNA